MNHSQKKETHQGMEKQFFRASAADFKKIPGSPISYWVSENILNVFQKARSLGDIAEVKHGLSTGKNEQVVRIWSEISFRDFGPNFRIRDKALASKKMVSI